MIYSFRKKRIRLEHSIFSLLIFLILVIPILSQEKFRRSPPFPDPIQELNLAEVESAKLSNDLTVSIIKKEGSGFITMQLIVLTGESLSPKNKPGLAAFTANMFPKGAENLSSTQVEGIIEFIGGNISISTFIDYTVFNFTFLEDYLDEALDLLSNMILRPTFILREIDNEKRNMYYDLIEKEKNPEYIGKKHLLQLLFENHSYQNSVYTEDFINNINQKDIFDFFDKYYRPNNAILLFTGNLNLRSVFSKTSHYLNMWKIKEIEHRPVEPPKPSTKIRVALINMPKVKDATLYLGNVICSGNNQDLLPFLVLNQVLGGTPNSRLFMNLRESKEYAYFAFSELELFKDCGVFFVKARIRPEVTYQSVNGALEEIGNILREEISSFEIEQAKSYLLGNFPLKIENMRDFSLKISEVIGLELGESFWSRYYQNMMLINAERVFNVAKKYPIITPVVVIIADKDTIIDYLTEFQEIEVFDSKGIFQYTISKGDEE